MVALKVSGALASRVIGAGPRGSGGRGALLLAALGGHEDAAGELRVVGHEVQLDRVADGVEDAHLRAPARAGADDDVVLAVAVDVGGGHGDALVEGGAE